MGTTEQSLSAAQNSSQSIVDDNKHTSWPDVFREGLVDASWQVFYNGGNAAFRRRNPRCCNSNVLIREKTLSGTFSGKGGIKGVANQHHLPGAKGLSAVECLDETFTFY